MLIYAIICTPISIYTPTHTCLCILHVHTAVHPHISTCTPTYSHPYSCTGRSIHSTHTKMLYNSHSTESQNTSRRKAHQDLRVQPLALHKCPNPAPESTAHTEQGMGLLSARRPPCNNAFDCHLITSVPGGATAGIKHAFCCLLLQSPPAEQRRARQASHSTGTCRSQSQHSSWGSEHSPALSLTPAGKYFFPWESCNKSILFSSLL